MVGVDPALGPREEKAPTGQRRQRRPRGLDERVARGGKLAPCVPFASNMVAFAIVVSKPASPSSALLTCAITNLPASIGAMAASVMSRLVVCSAPTGPPRTEHLEVDEQRTAQPRAPADHEIAVGQSGHHRHAMQPGDGVGAKLLPVFVPSKPKRCARMRSFSRLSAQTTTKPPSARRAIAGRISGSTSALLTWLSGPDSESASKVRSFTAACRPAIARSMRRQSPEPSR